VTVQLFSSGSVTVLACARLDELADAWQRRGRGFILQDNDSAVLMTEHEAVEVAIAILAELRRRREPGSEGGA